MADSDQTRSSAAATSPLLGALVAMMGLSLLVQIATLIVVVWFFASGGLARQAETDGRGRSGAEAGAASGAGSLADSRLKPNVAETGGVGFSPTRGPGPIQVLKELPPIIPESERDLVWYSAGDELFALQATGNFNFPGAINLASFRVPGRGTVDVEQGNNLYPGSQVTLLRVVAGRAVVGNSFGERELVVPSTGFGGLSMNPDSGSRSKVTSDPYPDMTKLDRPIDPRFAALADSLGNDPALQKMYGKQTGEATAIPTAPDPTATEAAEAAPTRPIETLADAVANRPIVETYHAKDWRSYLFELRSALNRSVIIREWFDAQYRPNGVELTRIPDIDLPLFTVLKLEEGDRVVGINGTTVVGKQDFTRLVEETPFASTIRFDVIRAGKPLEVRVDRVP